MALFVKEDRTQRPEEPHTLGAPARQEPAGARDVQAHLGSGSRIEGKLFFEGSVRIDGEVNGEISAKETVIIGESAVVAAQIQASSVVVQGRVQGDVTARKRIELRAPARLTGNLNTPSVIINEGVIFEGHCTMGTSETQAERSDKKIALFQKEERGLASRRTSEG
ncbi:MAG: hypothetical protein A3J75_06220 [Acidobacteria bacterium RBG_16_68_9]|nr:MAG: hypothetical protein A3J75_06220 [Acidobacteria bacterium RBG_16_68_9]